jgi:hypothetical protein
MKRVLMMLLAIVVSGLSFPLMIAGERARPNVDKVKPDTWPRLETPGAFLHDLKNLTTELVRADAQWWSKAGCFVVDVAIGLLLILLFP